MIVLLNDALMWAMPLTTLRRTFFFLAMDDYRVS
jgi:hypothetical protein